MNGRKLDIHRLTNDALLATVALTIFMIEAQIPPIVPIQGVKLGLANIITMYAIFTLSPIDGLMILLCRITLGSMFSGQMMSIMYSLAGGLLCYAVTLLIYKRVGPRQIWICGVIGAMAHSIGQMIVAVWVTKTVGLVVHLPLMLVAAIITGAFTGLCAQFLITRNITPKK